MSPSFVPENFQVPQKLETDTFRLRMLTVNDMVKDYDAVMSSIDHLQRVFGKRSTWPSQELTLEQDLIDLGWHQKEFQRRTSFAYTVMTLDESQCLGCVYVCPSHNEEVDAEIYLWVRQSAFEKGLDPIVFETVRHWITLTKHSSNELFAPILDTWLYARHQQLGAAMLHGLQDTVHQAGDVVFSLY